MNRYIVTSLHRPDPDSRSTILDSRWIVSLAVACCFLSSCHKPSPPTGQRPELPGNIWQSDGTAASVQFLHNNSAQNGDTITLPAGTFTWNAKVSITKAITLQGAGVGQTMVRDAVASGPLIEGTLVANRVTRITGIEFQDGGRLNGTSEPMGVIYVHGTNADGRRFRFDHNYMNRTNGNLSMDTVIGVIDHNTWDKRTAGSSAAVYSAMMKWDGGTWGDRSWEDAPNFGSEEFLFIEDNTFNDNSTLDIGYGGSRVVVRHNTFNTSKFTTHGTETSGRKRGIRAAEVYENDFHNLTTSIGQMRGGTIYLHHNRYYNPPSDQMGLTCYRMFGQDAMSIWDDATGENHLDVNDPANPYFSGTVSLVNSSLKITVNGSPGWTTNQWVGYQVFRASNVCGVTTHHASRISSNGTDWIQFESIGDSNFKQVSFCVGDTLHINRVLNALDQNGRARGTAIGDPINANWSNDQVIEPCYSWANTNQGTGAHINFSSQPPVREGVHYFNDTIAPGYTPFIYPHPLVSGEQQPSPTPSTSETPTATATATPTPTSTATATATATETPTPADSPSPSATPTPSSTSVPATATPAASPTPSLETPSPTPTATEIPSPTPSPTITPTPTPGDIILHGNGHHKHVQLTWAGAIGTRVDIYKDDTYYTNTANDGTATLTPGHGTHTWTIRETNHGRTSNPVTVTL